MPVPATRIALDAMGGDRAPRDIVAGAVAAAREDGHELLLVGQPEAIERELARLGGKPPGIELVAAPDVIGTDEEPVRAVRAKPESSIVVGLDLVRSGRASGFVSAGNTGAVMTAALFGLRRIRGVERPALATLYPTLQGTCLLVDVGANADCRPEQLVQFAIMGAIYLEKALDRPNPRVGLLSIGEEDTKGNALVRDAHALLRSAPINFVGNIEGKDIPRHAADVVVMDGFTGNVVLKVGESAAMFVKELLSQEARRDPLSLLGGLLLQPALRRVGRRVDYDEYGGAPLLGVDGVVAKAHGRSSVKAIRNALRVARHAVEANLVEAIRTGVGTVATASA